MKKKTIKIALASLVVITTACGGGAENGTNEGQGEAQSLYEKRDPNLDVPASQRVDLENKGVGQITELTLPEEIDQEMANAGGALFETNCTACHRIEERFIGPSPKGILERRSPEWIMNMILDPQLMVEEDRCAKDLLVEFNGAAMSNQNLTVDQVRSILEFYRTL